MQCKTDWLVIIIISFFLPFASTAQFDLSDFKTTKNGWRTNETVNSGWNPTAGYVFVRTQELKNTYCFIPYPGGGCLQYRTDYYYTPNTTDLRKKYGPIGKNAKLQFDVLTYTTTNNANNYAKVQIIQNNGATITDVGTYSPTNSFQWKNFIVDLSSYNLSTDSFELRIILRTGISGAITNPLFPSLITAIDNIIVSGDLYWDANKLFVFKDHFSYSLPDSEMVWKIKDKKTGVLHVVPNPDQYYFCLHGRDEWGKLEILPFRKLPSGDTVQYFPTVFVSPNAISLEVLDYGYYFLNADASLVQKLVPASKDYVGRTSADPDGNPYYDSARNTIIYFHGWQYNSTDSHKRERLLDSADISMAKLWIDLGWNVGIYYWNQFADDPLLPVEEKIYDAGVSGLTWKKEGDFTNPAPVVSTIAPGVPVKSLAIGQYNELFSLQTDRTKMRFAGHSLGGQLAAAVAVNIDSTLRPERIALLDMWWSNGKQSQLATNLDSLKNDSLALECYATSYLQDVTNALTLIPSIFTAAASIVNAAWESGFSNIGSAFTQQASYESLLKKTVHLSLSPQWASTISPNLPTAIIPPADLHYAAVRHYYKSIVDTLLPETVVPVSWAQKANNQQDVFGEYGIPYNYANKNGPNAAACTKLIRDLMGLRLWQAGGMTTLTTTGDIYGFEYNQMPEELTNTLIVESILPEQSDGCNECNCKLGIVISEQMKDDETFPTRPYSFSLGRDKAEKVGRTIEHFGLAINYSIYDLSGPNGLPGYWRREENLRNVKSFFDTKIIGQYGSEYQSFYYYEWLFPEKVCQKAIEYWEIVAPTKLPYDLENFNCGQIVFDGLQYALLNGLPPNPSPGTLSDPEFIIDINNTYGRYMPATHNNFNKYCFFRAREVIEHLKSSCGPVGIINQGPKLRAQIVRTKYAELISFTNINSYHFALKQQPIKGVSTATFKPTDGFGFTDTMQYLNGQYIENIENFNNLSTSGSIIYKGVDSLNTSQLSYGDTSLEKTFTWMTFVYNAFTQSNLPTDGIFAFPGKTIHYGVACSLPDSVQLFLATSDKNDLYQPDIRYDSTSTIASNIALKGTFYISIDTSYFRKWKDSLILRSDYDDYSGIINKTPNEIFKVKAKSMDSVWFDLPATYSQEANAFTVLLDGTYKTLDFALFFDTAWASPEYTPIPPTPTGTIALNHLNIDSIITVQATNPTTDTLALVLTPINEQGNEQSLFAMPVGFRDSIGNVLLHKGIYNATEYQIKLPYEVTDGLYIITVWQKIYQGSCGVFITKISTDTVIVARSSVTTGPYSFCPSSNITLHSSIIGANYQWQVNTGNGFENISDGTQYAGTQSNTLQLLNAPSSWYGHQFVCLVDGVIDNVRTIRFVNEWTGSVNDQWENPANWSCNQLPDQNTDAIISFGTVKLSSLHSVRSLKVASGAMLTLESGGNLTVVK